MVKLLNCTSCILNVSLTLCSTGCAVMVALAVLCLLLMQTGVLGFGIGLFGGNSLTHQQITESAILNVTLQVCHTLALAKGKDFTLPVRTKFNQIMFYVLFFFQMISSCIINRCDMTIKFVCVCSYSL